MKLTKLNELQVPTWRWLHLNSCELEFDTDIKRLYHGGLIASDADVSIEMSSDVPAISNIPGDVNRVYDFVSQNKNYDLTVTVPKGVRLSNPVTIDFELNDDNPALIDFIHVKAEEGSLADIIVTYHSKGNGSFFHAGFAYVEAASGSHVRLIKAQMLGDTDIHLDNNAINVQAEGQGDVIFCELGGGQTVSGCNVELAGTKSRSDFQSIYIGDKERKLDLNYRIELRGKETQGHILVRGALADQSKKCLKSNLDFIKGAAASRGSEEETVLTLSEKAVNLSVPLLLCGEDNVEGSHATSSGKPSPSKLFYLMSRGLSEKEAKRLLVEASFTPVLDNISSELLKATVQQRIREVLA